MSFAQDNGYVGYTFDQLMEICRNSVNSRFSNAYTAETFSGTRWYSLLYGPVQELAGSEVKTAEIFQKLQQYITDVNLKIKRPSTTNPGLIDSFEDEGYLIAIQPPAEVNAGKIFLAVDIADDKAGVAATGYFDITNFGNLISGTADSFGVGATTFTAQAGSVTPGGATFQAATSNAATATSLAAQINAHGTAGALVKARAFGVRIQLQAIARGTAGNSIALAYTNGDANIGGTKSGANLGTGTNTSAGADPDGSFAATKLDVATLIKDFVAAGIVSQGNQVESITLTNGQSFDFKFRLPDRIPVKLRLTLNTSENNLTLIPSDEELREQVFNQIATRYRLGYNFEPQRYFSVDEDAKWASDLELEWSGDAGTTWNAGVYDSLYDEVFDFDLEDIQIVINT